MAKASGSIDLKAVKNAHDDATKYITKIDDAGISVHPYNDTAGVAVTKDRAVITSDGLEIHKNDISVAKFGASGAQIGQSGATHTTLATTGMTVYADDGITQIASFGYDDAVSPTGTIAKAPLFTLGTRRESYEDPDPEPAEDEEDEEPVEVITATVGQYSTVVGRNNVALNYLDFAEGLSTVAGGHASHASGSYTYAMGATSYAGGDASKTFGISSFAYGNNVIARGDQQFVIGRTNVEDTTSALIIGNGYVDSEGRHPSNAFAVDWDGNITIGSNPLADWVTEKGTSGNWSYEKWASGKVEAYYSDSFTPAAPTLVSSRLYRSAQNALTIPSGIFAGTPQIVIASIANGSSATGWVSINAMASSSTQLYYQIWRTNESTSAVHLIFRATYFPSNY